MLQRDLGLEYPVTFHLANDDKAIGHQDDYLEQDRIEQYVAPYGSSLLRLFWRFIHPCYPIVHKSEEKYSISYREIAAPLLGAVYLIALNWWSYDPNLSNKSVPDVSLLRKEVIDAVQNSYHRPQLSSIEATLLLLQYKPEDALNPDHTWSWGYTAQALAIGQAQGLHLDASSWSIPQWERQLQKHLSWALYVQDKWTTLIHGRPSHFNDDDWGVRDLSDGDFARLAEDMDSRNDDIPSTDVEAGRTIFIETVALSKVLSDVLSQFYTLRASRIQDTVELYQQALPMLSRLQSWHQSFPPTLLMNNHITQKLSANGTCLDIDGLR